jgi:hypothetical protein
MNIEPTSTSQPQPFLTLQEEVKQSTIQVQLRINSFWGRLALSSSRVVGSIPNWATRHIEITERLFKEVQSAEIIPEKTLEILTESVNVIKRFDGLFDYHRFITPVEPKEPTVDRDNLLTLRTSGGSSSSSSSSSVSIPRSRSQWYLNLALLTDVYLNTENIEIKKIVAFLVNNYLAKAAPICPGDLFVSQTARNKLYEMFQISLSEPGISYNRESNLFDEYLRDGICRELARGSGNVMFLVETKEIGEIFPLHYSCIDTPESEEAAFGAWVEGMIKELQQHMARYPEDFTERFFDRPLLIDLTPMLEEDILASEDPERNRLFENKLKYIESRIEQAIDLAVFECAGETNARERLKALILTNLSCVSRCQVKSVHVVKDLPLFYDPKFFTFTEGEISLLGKTYESYAKLARNLLDTKIAKSKSAMDDFLNGTGLRLGSVSGRQKIFDFMDLGEFLNRLRATPVKYSGEGENALYFVEKLDLTNKGTFRRFENLFDPSNAEGRALIHSKPYLEVLGKPTLQLLRGLLTEISEEGWVESKEEPSIRMLVQTTLSRINIHLMNAEMYLQDFLKFSECIELIHYEIAALLKIFSPFNPDEFPAIYKNRLLSIIPEELRPFVKAGLTKSAMNTFAGMSLALRQTKANPVKTFHEGSHFEIVEFVGERYEFSKVLQNESIEVVDFYLGEFNHNVRLVSTHDEYKPGDVIADVTALLLAKPKTQYLTVAIDTTIDFIESSKIKEVLDHFSEEIKQGRLNFICFGSGQKFDLFGMDEYYGSRWFMINNGAEHWNPFTVLSSHEAFKTDLLTTQWFCLANKYSPNGLDVYRKAIFDNTKAILKQVPEILLPGGNPLIKVCKVAEGMEPCFLDIKCYGDNSEELLHQLEGYLYKIFTERNVKIHSRGGYGYFNPNINLFTQGLDRNKGVKYVTMRLHPGINPEENELFIDFLQFAAGLSTIP